MDRERAPLTEEEERLQDLRENRSSPRVLKLFFTVGKKERNSLSPSLISRATRPLLSNIPVHTERLENESSSLELIEISLRFPLFEIFSQAFRRFCAIIIISRSKLQSLRTRRGSTYTWCTRAYLIMTAIEISVRTGDTIINYAAIIVRHFVV